MEQLVVGDFAGFVRTVEQADDALLLRRQCGKRTFELIRPARRRAQQALGQRIVAVDPGEISRYEPGDVDRADRGSQTDPRKTTDATSIGTDTAGPICLLTPISPAENIAKPAKPPGSPVSKLSEIESDSLCRTAVSSHAIWGICIL